MNSKIYERPSFSMAKIEMNDLCSGSAVRRTHVQVDQGARMDYGYAMKVNDGTEGMWDGDF